MTWFISVKLIIYFKLIQQNDFLLAHKINSHFLSIKIKSK